MYLRRTQRKRTDGSVVGYLALAHNRRVNGITQAEVLVNLGREDEVDIDALRRLAASLARYCGEELTGTLALDGGAAGDVADFDVLESRTFGGVWLLDGLWKRLGVDRVLRDLLGARRYSTDVERVLFALVANRALEPMSKLAAGRWAARDAHIPGLKDGMDDDHAYRAMDVLVEADTEAKLQEAVFFACADLLNLEVDLLFFDTTSTYWETDTPDATGEDGTPSFRAFGHSKDHRPDLPQIVIGLAVTREGIPVRVWTWPGNTSDMSVLKQVKDDLRGWRLGRVVTVVDRGFSSNENLTYLTRAGGHWIAGERMRDGNKDAQAALGRPGRYQDVRDNLRVKDVRLTNDAGEVTKRFIVCHNPLEADRHRRQREDTLARLEAELERIAAGRKTAKTKTAQAAHSRAECALRDHVSLGRYLRQTATGRLVIDRAKIKAEERLDGKYLLSTSDPDLSAEDVALGYKNLLEAERGFRDLKSTLELRPVFHRLEHRIRAHILICWLALLLIRISERTARQTWNQISEELDRLHLVTLSGPAGTVQKTTRLTAEQQAILSALQLPAPPAITALHAA